MKWEFEEDYIVCNFYFSYIETWRQHKEVIMSRLASAGYGQREWKSVRMRLQNFEYLHTGRGLPNVAKLTEDMYNMTVRRKSNPHIYSDLEEYISTHYIKGDEIDATDTVIEHENLLLSGEPQNSHNFLYTRPLGPSFQEVLFEFIDERNMKDSQVYNACRVGWDTFSLIRSGKRGVSKRTVRQLCFGLKLSFEESVRLMESAGYAFSDNNLADAIVVYYLKKKEYDIYEVNATLYENNAELLFS